MKNATENGLAVVTGAAGGLGAAFAHQLAERGYRLLLVDRRPAPLQQVCEEIAAKHGTESVAHVADLCNRLEVHQLAERLSQLPDVTLLVNNAGFGTVDYFVDTDINFLVGQADLHVVTPTILTRAVLPGMLERNRGNIINVTSIGAWFHSAGNVQYGATKSFLASLSLSLQDELRGTNVRVQALCPGFVRTEFHAAESMQAYQHRSAPAAHLWMTADEVVTCSLRKLGSKKVLVTPGFGYSLVCRFAQMPFLRGLFQWIARKPRVSVQKPASEKESSPAAVFSVPKRA